MASGTRAELAVHAPAGCPLVTVAEETDSRVTGISWARPAGPKRADGESAGPAVDGAAADDSVAVEEFRVPVSATDEVPGGAEPVLDINDRRVYRVEHERNGRCACERIEALGCPIDDVQATDEALLVTVHLPALDGLRDIVDHLGTVADRVEVRSLVHGETEADADERPVVVDQGVLTDRQREVLQTAVEMRYFEYPREANGTEVAAELGIDVSTFSQHLAAAQAKLFNGTLSG